MNGDFPFSSLHNILSWVYRLVGHCRFLPVSISTRAVNSVQYEDCDIVKWGGQCCQKASQPCTCCPLITFVSHKIL